MAAAMSNLAGGPVIDALADAGAGIDAKDAQGRTAIMLAAVAGHDGKIVALLNAGASVNVTDMGGATALALAATGSGAPASAAGNDTSALKSLLEAGADPNIVDSQGVTPLMRAAQRDDVDAVILLLDHGALATTTTAAGKSALDYAQSLSGVRKVACIGVLKDAGAN
jgi:ankyrin repeat protein